MKLSLILFFTFLIPLAVAQELHPLEKVEQDQIRTTRSSDDIFNRNLALNSLANYTDVSSYSPGKFGWYAHDGDPRSVWAMHPDETEARLEMSWGLAVPVDRVIVSAAGSIDTLQVELYNGEQWEVLQPVESEPQGSYRFPLQSASALRIVIESEAGTGAVSEIEVFNTQSDQPLPRYGSGELIQAMREAATVILFDGSPYLFSRNGREMIHPRYEEIRLKDRWARQVLESVAAHLGGTVEAEEEGPLRIGLNGQSFELAPGPDAGVIPMLETLAAEAGLEFRQRGPLVMIGKGVEALDREALRSELEAKLSANPFRVSASTVGEPDAVVTPTLEPAGITYEWAGFRGEAVPGSNTGAWLKYAETKSVRTWRHAPEYMTMYIRPDETIETEEAFERYRDQVRNPVHGDRFKQSSPDDVVALRAFLNKYDDDISEEFSIYKRLGIELINATGPKNWPDNLHHDFINWASTYMMTYYLAKNFGVTAHQYGNEPDWYFDQVSDEVIRRRLTLIADAVHRAIEDVNRDHDLDLEALFSAPVLAGNFTGRNARIMMRNLYTDYGGNKTEEKQFNLFNRHRYSGRPHQNALEVRAAKEMMMEEAGEILPQVFTELNFSTARNWRRPETTFTNDTPEVFTSMAGIWGSMMEEQGVYGIFVFKLNDPGLWNWKEAGRFSNIVTYSMFPEQDPGSQPAEDDQIQYGTKNFEVCRLFGKGFHGSRPLLKTGVQSTDTQFRAWTSHDPESQRFYIWSVQVNEHEEYLVEFDLNSLGLPAGSLVTAEAVSGALHGEMTFAVPLPESGKIHLRQAPKSAVLLTVHARPLVRETFTPTADATVVQGGDSDRNFGGEAVLEVGRHSDTDRNRISFLSFEVPEAGEPVERAVLELKGHSASTDAYDGGFLFRVYAIGERDWNEHTITAGNAPNVHRTVSLLKEVNLDNYPVGHVTAFQTPSSLKVDATVAIREAQVEGRNSLTFVLIREVHLPGENTDDLSARISSREAGGDTSPALHLWK